MIQDALLVIWVFAPVGIANTAPVLVSKISALRRFNQPLDFNRMFHGKRVFGDHKTIRGLCAGIIFGLITATLQFGATVLFDWAPTQSTILDYSDPRIILFGGLLGFGALMGDAVESFFKRQINIAPGKSWFPFDQIDYLLGGLLVSLPFATLTVGQYGLYILIGFLIHPLINVISWLIGLQDHPF